MNRVFADLEKNLNVAVGPYKNINKEIKITNIKNITGRSIFLFFNIFFEIVLTCFQRT